MEKNIDQGMTILEVVFAITILLMGAGFLAKSNAVTFKYRDQSTEYKQMLFYASGQMDAVIETGNSVSDTTFSTVYSSIPVTADVVNMLTVSEATNLEKVSVQVSSSGRSPVIIYSYRLK